MAVSVGDFCSRSLQQITQEMESVQGAIAKAASDFYFLGEKEFFKEKEGKLMDKERQLIEERTHITVHHIHAMDRTISDRVANLLTKRLRGIKNDMETVQGEIHKAEVDYFFTHDTYEREYLKGKGMKLMDKEMKLIEERMSLSVAAIEASKL